MSPQSIDTIVEFCDWIVSQDSLDLYNLALFNSQGIGLTKYRIILAKLHDRKEHDLIYSLAINHQ